MRLAVNSMIFNNANDEKEKNYGLVHDEMLIFKSFINPSFFDNFCVIMQSYFIEIKQ